MFVDPPDPYQFRERAHDGGLVCYEELGAVDRPLDEGDLERATQRPDDLYGDALQAAFGGGWSDDCLIPDDEDAGRGGLGYPSPAIEQDHVAEPAATAFDPRQARHLVVATRLDPRGQCRVRRALPGAHADVNGLWARLVLGVRREHQVGARVLPPVPFDHVKRRSEPNVPVGYGQRVEELEAAAPE